MKKYFYGHLDHDWQDWRLGLGFSWNPSRIVYLPGAQYGIRTFGCAGVTVWLGPFEWAFGVNWGGGVV